MVLCLIFARYIDYWDCMLIFLCLSYLKLIYTVCFYTEVALNHYYNVYYYYNVSSNGFV